MTQLITVSFHDDTLYLVEHQGEPYVPVRPICMNLDLDWSNQFKKLQDSRWRSCLITTPSQGGMQKSLCLPLRKLPGWLYSISPAKVRPDIRPKLERYQEECDEVLWHYWNEGVAVNPRGKPADTIAIPKDEYIALLKALVETLKAQTTLQPGPRAWTPKEDQRLIDLRRQGLGFTRIGYRLGRSADSCKHRWRRLSLRHAAALEQQGERFARGGAA